MERYPIGVHMGVDGLRERRPKSLTTNSHDGLSDFRPPFCRPVSVTTIVDSLAPSINSNDSCRQSRQSSKRGKTLVQASLAISVTLKILQKQQTLVFALTLRGPSGGHCVEHHV